MAKGKTCLHGVDYLVHKQANSRLYKYGEHYRGSILGEEHAFFVVVLFGCNSSPPLHITVPNSLLAFFLFV